MYLLLGVDDAEIFRNRKSYMSINVQTMSDANLLITDLVARWPGSTHDSTIHQNSQRHRVFESGAYNVAYLLGDSGYPLKVRFACKTNTETKTTLHVYTYTARYVVK